MRSKVMDEKPMSRSLSRSPTCLGAVPGLSRCCHDECDRNDTITVFDTKKNILDTRLDYTPVVTAAAASAAKLKSNSRNLKEKKMALKQNKTKTK